MSWKTGVWAAAALAAASWMGLGCGRQVSEQVAEKAVEHTIERSLAAEGQPADVNIEGDAESFSVTVEGEAGTSKMTFGAAATMPEGFPEDVPLPEAFDLQFSQSASESQMFNLQGKVPGASVDDVAAFYRREAAAKGWTEAAAITMPGGQGMQMLSFTKDNRMLSLMLTVEEGEMVVHLTTGVQ